MTTKLLPRLLATGVLAVGLATISTIIGVAGSAHATPVVSDARSIDGSLKVTLSIVDIHTASHSVASADTLCTSTIIPAAATIDPTKVHDPVCAEVLHDAGVTYVKQSVQVRVSFYGDHTTTSAIRSR